MGAFITNFQSPVEIEDLIDRYENGETTNLDMVLHYEEYQPFEWTVDKDAKVHDIAVFMCAKTSKDHMGHVCAQAREEGDVGLLAFAENERELYKKYAGQIVAIGRVIDEPFQTQESGWEKPYWRSPWYAKIGDYILLDNPVSIDLFRDYITVSRTGAITKLSDSQWRMLFADILKQNSEMQRLEAFIR